MSIRGQRSAVSGQPSRPSLAAVAFAVNSRASGCPALREIVCGALLAAFVAVTILAPRTLGAVETTAELEAREEQAFKEAAALASPVVVRIETVGGLDRVGQMLAGTGPTTGVVVSADGYIISSAFNFALKPSSILVTLSDGRRLAAEQVATDRSRMLTLLKVDAKDLTPAQPAPPESFRVGQWALALGRTFDAELPSISVGIISALNRVWGKAIQTDAKISPVNYGGPLVDIQGRVLGVLVPLSPQASGAVAGVEWYDSGIGFAIPLADVYATLERLKTGKDLLPGLLGVSFQGRNEYNSPAVIDRLRYGSPAQQAGWKVGDVLVEVEGKPISRQAQARHLLGNRYAGDQVKMAVKRGDELIRSELTLAAELLPYESAFLGILPERPATDAAPAAGVTVRYVYPDSPAAQAGIKIGDRILRLGTAEATNAAALTDLVSRVRPADTASLKVRTGEAERDIEVKVASLPESVPAELKRVFIPPVDKDAAAARPKVGRFSETLAAHEHDYWAYVPEDYNPAHKYALLVWIHPGGDTMEATMIKSWKSLCDERGIILLAPKAKKINGWEAGEAEFVKAIVGEFKEKYAIDPARVLLHSFASGGPLAYHLAFEDRELFKGLAVASSPLTTLPPDNEPGFRLQVYLICGDKDPGQGAIEESAKVLRSLKYPVTLQLLSGIARKYSSGADLEPLVRWIDSLDRI